MGEGWQVREEYEPIQKLDPNLEGQENATEQKTWKSNISLTHRQTLRRYISLRTGLPFNGL